MFPRRSKSLCTATDWASMIDEEEDEEEDVIEQEQLNNAWEKGRAEIKR